MTRRLSACFIAVAAGATFAATCAWAKDWPQWRGPDRTAVSTETGLLQRWPDEGPPLAWKIEGLGGGYSAPAIAEGRIYGMSFREGEEVVWALDETTGKEIWHTTIAPAKRPGLPQGSEGSHGTPTVAGGSVYVVGISGEIACLEAASGKERWHKSFASDFGGKMMSNWGYSESPLLDGDKLICTPGGPEASVVALNKETGDVVWKAKTPEGDKAGYSSPIIAEVDGLRMVVQLMQKGMVGVAAENGRFLWRYDRMANKVANITTPVVRGNLVFASTAYRGGSGLVRLKREGDRVEAEEVYFIPAKTFQNHHGGVVLVGDYLYGGHGQNNGAPVCLEFTTGKVAWREDRPPGHGSAAVAAADGQVYFRYDDGTMTLIQTSPEGYKLNGKFKLPDNSGKPNWSHPVIANGKLYLRDQGTLLCYDVQKK